ncbi:MAG: S9 family peptidase [Bacteroidales bacterium]|nr:S9 family peptidase [Bacteroidales bacterium]
MKTIRIISAAAAMLAAASLNAQTAQNRDRALTLEDIYVNRTFTQTSGAPSIRWSTGSSYDSYERSLIVPSASERAAAVDDNQPSAVSGGASSNGAIMGMDIVSTDIKTGKKTVMVHAAQLIPAGAREPLRVESYTWSADRSKLLIFTNSRRVWRQNTRGDYWVLNLATNELKQLGKGLDESRLMFAKISPDGRKAAYVYYNNVYVEDLATGVRKALTSDGDDVIVNGTFDWVYEEELSCRDGFRWSPDSKRIAFWRSDTEGTGVFNIINNIDSVYSFNVPFPYPKAGTTNSAVKVGVVEVADGATRWFDLPGDPRQNYIARMDFVPDSGSGIVMIQQLNRLQNTNTVWYGDAVTMSLDNFLTDHDDAFLDIHDNIVWMDKNRAFTWTSEKDGWLHLYKMARDGKSEVLITKGDFDVMNILRIDVKGGYVYYMASPYNATESYLYRSRLDGKGRDERVTPEGLVGTHRYSISEDCKYAVHSFSNAWTPTQAELITLPDHKTVQVYADGANVKAEFDSWGFNYREYFKVNIGGDFELDAWMLKPRNFDPDKKYPVIFNVYGEPASSTVQNSWSSDLYNRVLNENGYIVMSVDPRGTHNYRGREWRKSIYGKVGDIAIEDHAKAVAKIIEMFSFVDADRIGVWGWSGGGSSTAHLMFKHPELYNTGIAVAGVYSQYLYDTIYQERYQGLPQTNPEGYYKGSPINYASGLKGNLFLIHGTGDDNVHYQSCEMLVNELVKQNKMFSMMAYPMRTHGISERDNTSYHLYQTMLRYWIEHL